MTCYKYILMFQIDINKNHYQETFEHVIIVDGASCSIQYTTLHFDCRFGCCIDGLGQRFCCCAGDGLPKMFGCVFIFD